MGLNRSFKKILAEASLGGSRLAYIGTPSVCLPVAELLAYAVRELNLRQCFIPNARREMARELVFSESYGFQLGERSPPEKSKAAVVLGGLAMPSYAVRPEDVNGLLAGILEEGGLVIGIAFMGMFEKANWTEKLKFDFLIDATIDPVKVEAFS